MTLYALTVTLHAGLGTLALATFWLAGLSRKGSPLHRAAGKVYLPTMATLLLAAVPLALAVIQRMPVAGSFLFYLLLITVTSVWSSWRAVKDKKDWARYTGPVFHALMWANLLGALAIAGVGLFLAKHMQLVIVAFSGIGLVGFVQMWRFSRRPPQDPRWWLREHLTAMLGNGVATHIAFLSIGLPKLLPMLAGPTLQKLAWLGPLFLAFLAGAYLTRKFLPKRAVPMAGARVAG